MQRYRKQWVTAVKHSREGSRHRYECECCGKVWRLETASDYNHCPYCGMKSVEVEDGE